MELSTLDTCNSLLYTSVCSAVHPQKRQVGVVIDEVNSAFCVLIPPFHTEWDEMLAAEN